MTTLTFVILSFEGPDKYSHAGGLATRVTELSKALAAADFETHLFFIGDPGLPGHEVLASGKLQLHRWCQWISGYHPGGVYDGEEGKLRDWNTSLPGWIEANLIAPKASAGEPVIIIGEEWQTVSALVSLREIVNRRGWQERVHLLWNANNTFSFERIDWGRLKESCLITTVSRYMKHLMWGLGVDAQVIPNGIPESWLEPVPKRHVQAAARVFNDRLTLLKMARWDPDKRWDMAIDAVAELKALGLEPLLLARGSMDADGREELARAERQGLRVNIVEWQGSGLDRLLDALVPALDSDMVLLKDFVSEPQRRTLFHAADAVLANSGREPFGLVGLETMAVGGVAMVGSTGEDYATPGHDSISLQTSNHREIVQHIMYLRGYREFAQGVRQNARRAAARYTWPAVIRRSLLPLLGQLGVPVILPDAALRAAKAEAARYEKDHAIPVLRGVEVPIVLAPQPKPMAARLVS